jgi:hypothetical protein
VQPQAKNHPLSLESWDELSMNSLQKYTLYLSAIIYILDGVTLRINSNTIFLKIVSKILYPEYDSGKIPNTLCAEASLDIVAFKDDPMVVVPWLKAKSA